MKTYRIFNGKAHIPSPSIHHSIKDGSNAKFFELVKGKDESSHIMTDKK